MQIKKDRTEFTTSCIHGSDSEICAILTDSGAVEITVGGCAVCETTITEYAKILGIPEVRRIDFEVKIDDCE